MRRAAPIFVLLAGLAIPPVRAAGQQFGTIGGRLQSPVTLALVDPVEVAVGKSAEVQLHFRVLPGYHINSNTPASGLLMPTVLKLNPPTNIFIGKISYPKGGEMSFSFAPKEKLNVYTGKVTLTAHVLAARNTVPGTYRVRGALEYQSCDDKACYPPGKVPVIFDVNIVRPHRAARRNPAQSPHAR